MQTKSSYLLPDGRLDKTPEIYSANCRGATTGRAPRYSGAILALDPAFSVAVRTDPLWSSLKVKLVRASRVYMAYPLLGLTPLQGSIVSLACAG
jgi:hypothetical protein